MIDCSRTKNYFVEKKRMTKTKKYVCEIDCDDCPLSSLNNGINISCSSLETDYPDKAIEIVQKWSDRNPPNTILDNFNKLYPDAVKAKNGIPHICCAKLGLVEYCGELFSMDCERCKSCWHTIAKES